MEQNDILRNNKIIYGKRGKRRRNEYKGYESKRHTIICGNSRISCIDACKES